MAEITIDGKTYQLKHYTVKQRMELDQLRKVEDKQWDAYFKTLQWGADITKEQIENMAGQDADNLFVAVLEHNKPPLELLQRLQVPSTQESTTG
jgi:hypothetical protein